MGDPGISLKCATLLAAWRLLFGDRPLNPLLQIEKRNKWSVPLDEALLAEDAVEELALDTGMRSRRVLLDGGWWKQAATPMLARVADRRRVQRGEEPPQSAALASGTGWVALVPRAHGGYRMLAAYPDESTVVEWPVDEEVAARLAPFAFTFHPRFAPRELGARDILRFAFSQGGRDLGLLLLAGFVAALVGLLTPAATGWLIDRAIPSGSVGTVGALIATLGLAGIALLALDLLRSYAVLRFETRLGVAMQAALVDRVISAPARFFRAFSSGDLALRMASVNTVQRTITGSTIETFVTSLFLFANLALMLAYSPALTLAATAIVILVIALSTTLGLMRLRIGPRIEALDGKLSAMTFELFAGIPKLRAAAAEPRVYERWYAKYHEFRNANGDSARLSNYESIALSLLQPAATILVLALAWKLAASSGRMTTGDFVAFHAALLALLGGVHGLVSTALEVVNLKPVWDRARPILETAPEDAQGGGERHDPTGGITLSGVSFAYPGGPAVLKDIDLEIRSGEFVAIVGASGSGKSTLLRLLLGFEAPASGFIRYDLKDLATLDLKHLRSRIGTVLQGGRLWAGDLLTNIMGTATSDVEAAWDAARTAGLAADIEAMPMGLYTVVGEGLSTLSGGQRQRVLIARALVHKPCILLLDEATSALDNVSQATVLEGLSRVRATRVVIAHRLNTVRDADRIVVLENGRIVQQGTFRELAEQRGAFSAMLARQVA
ncbi:MAG TPA: ATP-binding cassette domain-containing protein [Usitatibacter sp.]|nr:ATP-binding cassette domain-containing protein [Usitatibacter sp.]